MSVFRRRADDDTDELGDLAVALAALQQAIDEAQLRIAGARNTLWPGDETEGQGDDGG